MATYSRALLSGSTSGKPILVAATATPGTVIHTAVAGSASFDEVYLWVSNTSGAAVPITIEWGGTTDPGDLLAKTVSIPANSGPTLLVNGEVLNGGLSARAYAGSAGALNLSGYVNRIA